MRKTFTLLALMIALLMGLCGCTVAGYTVAKRADIDARIDAARIETTAKLEALRQQEVGLLKQVINQHEARLQQAADHLFKGSVVYGMMKPFEITRPVMVLGQSVQLTVSQLPPATAAAQAAALKALQTELDETKVTTEQLKAQYQIELDKARTEGAEKAAKVVELGKQLEQVQAAKIEVLQRANAKEVELQAAKDKVQDRDTAKALEEAASAKRNEKIKMWLIGILLVAAAACGIGAAFVPIPPLKSKLIVGAAICGGAAIVIPFIEPWMVMVAVGGALLLVAAWVVKNYRDDHVDAIDTYRALNEVKTKAADAFKTQIAPILKEWHTDPGTRKRIDDRLKEVGDT